MNLVKVTEEGRYTNIFVRDHMVASLDHEMGEIAVYGHGELPLDTIEVEK